MNKKMLWRWLIIGVLILIVVFVFSAYMLSYYWTGIDIDEDLLMELCGITREEYLSEEFNPDDCPESELAISIVGGISVVWIGVAIFTLSALIIYLAVSGAIFLIVRFVKNRQVH